MINNGTSGEYNTHTHIHIYIHIYIKLMIIDIRIKFVYDTEIKNELSEDLNKCMKRTSLCWAFHK